jgi:large subunit ribosomal protein L21
MYAIFRAVGFQYRAEPGATLKLPTLEAEPGQRVEFDQVLLGGTEDEVLVGRPLLSGAKVVAEVVRHGRGDKVIVWKFRRRENYRRKQGHRQGFTEVRVHAVDLGDGRRAETPAARAAARPAKKRAARKTARKAAARKATKTARARAPKSKRASGSKKPGGKKKE